MKKVSIFMTLGLLCMATCFAQDSTGTGTPTDGSLPPLAVTILSIVVGIYELLVRYIPTMKNYSLIGFIIKALQALVPNRSTDPAKKLP